ncbi:MAG: class I SAM-dependent methyltransferase [Alphaproteobacteria bacterium]|jgi:SAM-dependent methyltransferase|nr:class I SAM-dependent methyltransferase [Alphaproteobacteria bacterium]
MTTDILENHREIWRNKPVLKAIYQDFYDRITSHATSGTTLEIGGGTGNLKEYLPHVISSDIISSPWLDCVCDAQKLPLENGCLANIVAIDVLHHIERPIRFFQEASKALQSGGRIILLDPAITPLSWFFYHFIHEEPVILDSNPLEDGPLSSDRKPFDANQAIPTLLFGKHQAAFSKAFPDLRIIQKSFMSLWCYPLSGGFKRWSLIPKFLIKPLLAFEKIMEPYFGFLFGFRILIVLEKI